jgi:hypothetical protein
MDTFSGLPSNLTAPARDGASVTPSDSTNLSVVPRALYVGLTGNVSAVLLGGQSISFQGVQAGTVLPVRVTRVNATGTTAGGIVALW